MFRRFRKNESANLLTSQLFDQNTFYNAFLRDLHRAKSEVIIESPFITSSRIRMLLPAFHRLRKNDIEVVINTRHPDEHDPTFALQAENSLNQLQALGVRVLFTGGHHRKLSIIDRRILWEGSLNILSHNDSCEIMRKITSEALAEQMIHFAGLGRYLRKTL